MVLCKQPAFLLLGSRNSEDSQCVKVSRVVGLKSQMHGYSSKFSIACLNLRKCPSTQSITNIQLPFLLNMNQPTFTDHVLDTQDKYGRVPIY